MGDKPSWVKQEVWNKLNDTKPSVSLMTFIEENIDKIYVRERIAGSWVTIALSELPAKLAIHWAFFFLRRSQIAYRLYEQEKE